MALNFSCASPSTSTSLNLGGSWRWSFESRCYGRFSLNARFERLHELEDIGSQGVRYADWETSPTYLVRLDKWSRDTANLGLGLEGALTDRMMFSFGYRSMLGSTSASQGGTIGLKYGW